MFVAAADGAMPPVLYAPPSRTNRPRQRLLRHFVGVLCAAVLSGRDPAAAASTDDLSACQQTSDLSAAVAACGRIAQDTAASTADRVAAGILQGYAHTALGDVPAAVADYTRAIESDRTAGAAFLYRALARFSLDDKSGAVDDFLQANMLDPKRLSEAAAASRELVEIRELAVATSQQPERRTPPDTCDSLAASAIDKDRPFSVRGTPQIYIDVPRAIDACKAGLERHPGERRFMTALGRAYLAGQQPDKAAEVFRSGANLASLAASVYLAERYELGNGLRKDEVYAFSLMQNAADAGYAPAKYDLGLMYRDGIGVSKDRGRAQRLVREASDAGYLEATAYLGICYLRGQLDVKQDESEGVRLLQIAAEAHDPGAELTLGSFLMSGEVALLPKDAAAAANFFQRALDDGRVAAFARLGYLYAEGSGVTQDKGRAEQLFRNGAGFNERSALLALAMFDLRGEGPGGRTAASDAEALDLVTRAAERYQDDEAERLLGLIHENGIGVPKDQETAKQWYRKAAEQGNDAAKAALAKIP